MLSFDYMVGEIMKNKKGFTLIELLAVIIILGILMIIAVPAVTKYIDGTRKSTYVNSAKGLVGGARTLANSGKLNMDDTNTTYYIPTEYIKTESDLKTPYGELTEAYVGVICDDEGHSYYWVSRDNTGTGISSITPIDKFVPENLENDIPVNDVTNKIRTTGIGNRTNIKILQADGTWETIVLSDTSGNIGEDGKINKACAPVTETIYWAVQSNKLVISDSEVSGDRSGSFDGNTIFSSTADVPWTGPSYSSNYISQIEISGKVVPASTAYWFSNVGYSASTFTGNLEQLEVCRVTDMSNMFDNCGANASTWNIGDLGNWNTSRVTNMYQMFYEAGDYSSSWYAGNIGNWDVSKVTNMEYLFYYVAEYDESFSLNLSNWDTSSVTTMHGMFSNIGLSSKTWSLGNLSNWNTSNVTDMAFMFSGLGGYNSSWSLGNIGNWDTSKVVNMEFMFYNAGQNTGQVNAATFNLDLSGWDTSKVTSMEKMFYQSGGYNVTTYNLNLNNWNTSRVDNTYNMFSYAGDYVPNFNITIPRTNGNGINNTTTSLYGASTSYIMEPPYGREFTLAS